MKKLFVVESCDLPFKNIGRNLAQISYASQILLFEDIIFLINSYFLHDY